jgi:tRNA(fMet)-specific endonuclease VapC
MRAAGIYADLHRRGLLIGDADILIAATALQHDCVLTTNNTNHFNRIAGLQLQNWLSE